jgi:hypothetical protein
MPRPKLRALVVGDDSSSQALAHLLEENESVEFAEATISAHYAYGDLMDRGINLLFVDPFSYQISSRFGQEHHFVFDVRERFPHVVFVLYYDSTLLSSFLRINCFKVRVSAFDTISP